MSEQIKRDKSTRKTVTLDKPIVQGGVDIKPGDPVDLYPDQIKNLKEQGISSTAAPAQKEG